MKDNNQDQLPALTSNNAMRNKHETDPNVISKNEALQQAKKSPYFITHTYAEAIRAGFLVDVSHIAQKLGFFLSVALTRAVWEDCVAWREGEEKSKDLVQSEEERLLELLRVARAAYTFTEKRIRRHFEIYRVPPDGKTTRPERVDLSMYTSPRYHSPSTITIMLQSGD